MEVEVEVEELGSSLEHQRQNPNVAGNGEGEIVAEAAEILTT